MKKKLLAATAIAGAMAMGASAATTTNILDEWTFTSATPEKSDIQNKTMGNWTTNAPNSVPSAGLLRDATGGNSTGGWYGDNLGLSDPFDRVTITLEIADINHADRDYWLEFLGTTGGNMRGEINASGGGNIFFDVEGGGTALKDVAVGYGSVFNVAEYTGAISMEVAFTWDFASNTLSYTVSGDGVGYTGTGSSAFSDTQTVAADLSGITNIKQMRVRGNTVGAGEYIDVDNVRIETMVTVEEPPPPAEFVTVEQWNFDGADTAEGVNGLIMNNWSNTAPNSVPSPGILRYETPGKSDSDGFSKIGGLKAASIKKLIMEVDLADFLAGVGTTNGVPDNTGNDVGQYEIFTDGGTLALQLNAFSANGQFSPDLEQGLGSTDDLDLDAVMDWATMTNESPIILTCTWDFENLEMSLDITGTATAFDTVPATNLANIVNIWRMRARYPDPINYGSFQELNSVTIKYESYFEQGTYEFWLSQYDVGTATNKTDNPDGDALNNLYEYGLGGNPGVADTGIQGTFQLVGNNMEYVHVQRNDDTNLVYQLALTDDLVNGTWTNAGYTITGVNTNSGITNFDTVTNSIPADVKDQQFIKLIIE